MVDVELMRELDEGRCKVVYRALDDEAWSLAPAQGRHFRECMSTRLQNGFEDRILVECSHRDNRRRKNLKPATFYALLQMPRQDDGEFTRFRRIFEDPHLASSCLRSTRGRVNTAFLTRAEAWGSYDRGMATDTLPSRRV